MGIYIYKKKEEEPSSLNLKPGSGVPALGHSPDMQDGRKITCRLSSSSLPSLACFLGDYWNPACAPATMKKSLFGCFLGEKTYNTPLNLLNTNIILKNKLTRKSIQKFNFKIFRYRTSNLSLKPCDKIV
jgi:hypothetical protein